MTSKDDFASFMESSFSETNSRAFRRLKKGEVVEGKIIQVSSDSIFVDLGTRADGRIARSEFENEKGELSVGPGDRIKATVVDPHATGGPLLATALSRDEADISALQFAMDTGVPIEGRVAKVVNGGLEVDLGEAQAFCPASQIEIGYTAELGPYIGQNHRFKVIEIRDNGRSVVVSRRALLEQERKEKAQQLERQLSVGEDRTGVVASIQKYGAFIDLGGIQGLLHISELIQGRVERVEDVIQVGETITVRILDIDKTENGTKVRLSMKALQQEDKKEVQEIGADEILQGKVTRLTSFGLFVETPKGEGLVIAQDLNLPPGSDHRRAFPVGKAVEVVLLERDEARGRLRFSISGVLEVSERHNFQEYKNTKSAQEAESTGNMGSLGELLHKKLGLKPPPPSPTPEAHKNKASKKVPQKAQTDEQADKKKAVPQGNSATPTPENQKGIREPKDQTDLKKTTKSQERSQHVTKQTASEKPKKQLPPGVFRRKPSK